MFYEVVDYLLLLAMTDPEDMTILHIYDVSGLTATIVELELIDANEASSLLRLLKGLAIDGVLIQQTLLVYLLDDILADAGEIRYFLIGVVAGGKQIPGIVVKLFGDLMILSLEWYVLHLCSFAFRASKLSVSKGDTGQIASERQMSERNSRSFAVGVHAPSAALADTVRFSQPE